MLRRTGSEQTHVAEFAAGALVVVELCVGPPYLVHPSDTCGLKPRKDNTRLCSETPDGSIRFGASLVPRRRPENSQAETSSPGLVFQRHEIDAVSNAAYPVARLASR